MKISNKTLFILLLIMVTATIFYLIGYNRGYKKAEAYHIKTLKEQIEKMQDIIKEHKNLN